MGRKIQPWIALKKKRGGQPGNQNRRIHGRYSREARERRARLRERIRLFKAKCDAVIAQALKMQGIAP